MRNRNGPDIVWSVDVVDGVGEPPDAAFLYDWIFRDARKAERVFSDEVESTAELYCKGAGDF